jgi:tRNA/rRNA methyltransferase
MKNMGFRELCLVAPRTPVGKVGARMAAHAGDVLAARRTVATLQEAVADCVLTIGTVGRETARREAPLDPPRFAAEALAATAHGPVALVFGPEDHGLSNAEIDLCQKFVTLPTDPGYASLNLAQAVLLCTSEILRADPPPAATNEARRARRREGDSQPASGEAREALFEHLEEALAQIGFLDQQNPAHILRDVRALFARAGATVRDVAIWRGIARQMLWSAGRDTERD